MSDEAVVVDAAGVAVAYRDVPDFPGYRVGSDGSVWSCRDFHGGTTREWHRMKPGRHKFGYPQVYLCICGSRKMFQIHRLVLMAFVGLCPEGMECRHLNSDPTDNRLENLCWGSHRENVLDMVRAGRRPEWRGERSGNAKVAEQDIRDIRAAFAAGELQREIAQRYGLTQGYVSEIVNLKKWAHVK